MTAPHPLRCETCNYATIKKKNYEDGNIIEIHCRKIDEDIAAFDDGDPYPFSKVGCASHSSIPTSAEQVLEKFKEIFERIAKSGTCLRDKEGWFCDTDYGCQICTFEQAIAELRQQERV